MSTLQERLDRMKAGNLAKLPDEVKAVMKSAEDGIRNSGILSRLPEAGAPLPAFALADTEGRMVRSDRIQARGPYIVTFYRGAW